MFTWIELFNLSTALLSTLHPPTTLILALLVLIYLAMTCRCSVNSLRSFVRAVAQVDIPSTRSSVSRFTSQRPQAAIRGLSLPRQCRYKSTDSPSAPPSHQPEYSNAFADFSLEAIDAIAEESKSTPQIISKIPDFDENAIRSRKPPPSKPREKKHEEKYDDEGITPTFRRTKVINTSFALHYSSPRAPVFTKSSSGPPCERNTDIKLDGKPVGDWMPPEKEQWQIQKAALKEKFPDGWAPLKRLSPDAMAGIRALHAQMPEKYTTEVLAQNFEVSAEGIRRILKSKWVPTAEVQTDRELRWFRRGEKVWSRYAELGVKPPRRWRDAGIGRGKPEWLKPREEKIKPALLELPRREGGNFGDKFNKTAKKSHLKAMDEMPELVTTRRPDGQ